MTSKIFRERTHFYEHARIKRLLKPDAEKYNLKNIKLPLMSRDDAERFIFTIYDDIFTSYDLFGDAYDEKTFDLCDKMLPEGLYGLVNDRVNVAVKPGDIVIDAGSWIGDFASYASVKGATVYAFEPGDAAFELLTKTAGYNKNIIPVKKGLSDKSEMLTMFTEKGNLSQGNSFIPKPDAKTISIDVVSLDDFVRENNLPHVDFIKSDIEGLERNLLAGAQETLARFAPKLALCTYHLPDDPEVMSSLILKANPRYNIVQKRKKLFASVPAV